MGLSDTRAKKRKIAADPRNTRWASDETGKGYQMLSKMGWQGSHGLTVSASSQSKLLSRIPVAKEDTMGIGANKSNTGAFLSALGTKGLTFVTGGSAEQQRHLKTEGSDFTSLLARLNSARGTPSTSREGSEQSRQIVHRNASRAKHLKAKRMAFASQADLASILGTDSSTLFSQSSVPASTLVEQASERQQIGREAGDNTTEGSKASILEAKKRKKRKRNSPPSATT